MSCFRWPPESKANLARRCERHWNGISDPMNAGAPNTSRMGKALGGGSGWVLLSWSPRDRKLVNQWASDHCHTLAGGTPILALDMYEHSYHIDFGAKAGELRRHLHERHSMANDRSALRQTCRTKRGRHHDRAQSPTTEDQHACCQISSCDLRHGDDRHCRQRPGHRLAESRCRARPKRRRVRAMSIATASRAPTCR